MAKPLWSNSKCQIYYMSNVNEVVKKIEIKLFILHDWRRHFSVNKMLPAK